ncbi:hypothetical protein D3C79_866590 [compost metagenome]
MRVPYFSMCSRPAPPKNIRAPGMPMPSGNTWAALSKPLPMVSGRSVQKFFNAPGCICSKPKARAQSTAPLSTAWRAMNSAVEPLAQLLLTLISGMPVMPTSYSADWPQVESP